MCVLNIMCMIIIALLIIKYWHHISSFYHLSVKYKTSTYGISYLVSIYTSLHKLIYEAFTNNDL